LGNHQPATTNPLKGPTAPQPSKALGVATTWVGTKTREAKGGDVPSRQGWSGCEEKKSSEVKLPKENHVNLIG